VWNQYGLAYWCTKENKFIVVVEAKPNPNKIYNRKNKTSRVLLVDENKGLLAGVPSGKQKVITHWSQIYEVVHKWSVSQPPERVWDLKDLKKEAKIPHLHHYKNPDRTLKEVLNIKCDRDRDITKVGRCKYQTPLDVDSEIRDLEYLDFFEDIE
jgi:hypothetical protein